MVLILVRAGLGNGHYGETAQDVAYFNWLSMARAGVLGLEYFTPEHNKWRQVYNTVSIIVCTVNIVVPVYMYTTCTYTVLKNCMRLERYNLHVRNFSLYNAFHNFLNTLIFLPLGKV